MVRGMTFPQPLKGRQGCHGRPPTPKGAPYHRLPPHSLKGEPQGMLVTPLGAGEKPGPCA
jgi:hypothetical protein